MTTSEKRKIARNEIIRKLKYERDHPQNGFTKRIDWPSSNGADYSIASYFNVKDEPCIEEEAIYCVSDDYTNDGKILNHDTIYLKNSNAYNAKLNKEHPMRKFQIEQIQGFMSLKCGTPLMYERYRIREDGKEKGWSDEYIHQLCEEASEMQNFRWFRADKIDLRIIEILQTTDNISQREAREQAEAEVDAVGNMQALADEFLVKWEPNLNAEERLERWKILMGKYREGK